MTEVEPGSEKSFTRSRPHTVDTGQCSNNNITDLQQSVTKIDFAVNPKYLTVQNGRVSSEQCILTFKNRASYI